MIQVHGAVLVDVHERSSLVEMRCRERYAELDRRHGDAALQNSATRIEFSNSLASLDVFRIGFEFVDNVIDDVVVDLLLVLRNVTFANTVEIPPAHCQRVLSQCTGNIIDDVFDRVHALRPAETAKSGIRYRVGLATIGSDVHILEEVSVVAVKHCAIVDWPRQIRRNPASRCEHEVHPVDAAGVVKADFVVDDEIVSFAGHDHVVVAIQPQLAGPTRFDGHDRGNARDCGRLALLAAECATHASANADHVLGRATRRVRDKILHFVRVLC